MDENREVLHRYVVGRHTVANMVELSDGDSL